jgi:hypothetical protein
MSPKLKCKLGRPEIGKPYTCTLSTDQAKYARRKGDGSVQSGIRKIIQLDMFRSELHAEMERDLADSTLTEFENAI